MSKEVENDLELEIAHVLLIDVVGYSKLLVGGQIAVLDQLNHIVRGAQHFRSAETKGTLMRLPTGDGMALLFLDSPEAPVQCALEISRALREHPEMQLRMGAHSGPIKEVVDVNDRSNFAGSGINMAQRVLDCGDAGHILLSARLAEDLLSYQEWHPYMHDLGECEVKHGVKIHLFNLCKDGLGNPTLPEKVRQQRASLARVRRATAGWYRAQSRSKRIVAAVAAALFLLAAAIVWRYARTPEQAWPPLSPEKSIAILPFASLSDDKANAYFADGVQDEILTDLAKLSGLKVISRTSVMRYKPGADWNTQSIGRELGVAHVLEGSVQRIANHVRVHAQLIETKTDRHIWANRYDRELSDVFAIQSEVAEEIVAQLRRQLSPSEKAAIEDAPTKNLVAYEGYVRAKSLIDGAVFSARATEDFTAAAQLLTEAVSQDRAFYLAYYQLAHTHDQLYLRSDQSSAHLALAESAIRSLQNLRPDSGEAHLALAKHLYWGYLDYERARQELALAEAKLPNDPTPPLLRGYMDRRQGAWDDSTKNLNRALELDPQNFFILQQLSISYQNQRRFRETAALLDRALVLAPNDLALGAQRAAVDLEWNANTKPLHDFVASVLATKPATIAVIADQWFYLALCERDFEATRDALRLLSADACQTEGVPFPRSWCAGVAARLGGDEELAGRKFREARAEVEKMVGQQPESGGAYCALGMIEAALGDATAAVRDGERAVQLLPVSKDAIHGSNLLAHLALIYAWTGRKDLALEKLAVVANIPGNITYGYLRLHPYFDSLRDDPRFAQITASLAPE